MQSNEIHPINTYSVCVVVEDHQVAVAHVEARQMVTGVLGVEDVLINYVGRSSGFWRVATENTQDVTVNI